MRQQYQIFSSCILLLLMATVTLKAQTTTNDETFISQPDFAIKFAPLPLLSSTPAIQFGVEAKTFDLQGLQVEFGYITSSLRKSDSDFDGFKLKSEYRFYKKQINNFSNIRFTGIQHMYKTVDVEGAVTIWRNNQSYQQIVPVKVKNKINSFFLVGGFAEKFSSKLYFEFAAGVGVRLLNIQISDLPDDAELETNLNRGIFDPIREAGNYRFLDAFISLKLAYYL